MGKVIPAHSSIFRNPNVQHMESYYVADLRSRCSRAGLSAPKACTREKSKDFVHESSAEGVYARFYSRAHAHCAREILFCASRMSAMSQEIN